MAFDPAGRYLVTGSGNAMKGPMWRWDWRETDPVKARTRVPGEPVQVDALAFSRDGIRSRPPHGRPPSSGRWASGADPRIDPSQPQHAARAMAFHPDGKRLALGGEDTTVRMYEFGWLRNSVKPPLTGHTDAVASLTYSPGGTARLRRQGRDDSDLGRDRRDTAPRAVLRGHKAAVAARAIHGEREPSRVRR